MNAEGRGSRFVRTFRRIVVGCALLASCATTQALPPACDSALDCGPNDRCARGRCMDAAMAFADARRYVALCASGQEMVGERCRCEATYYVLGLGDASCGASFRFYDPPPARVASYLASLDSTPAEKANVSFPQVECNRETASHVCGGGGTCMRTRCVPWSWILAAARRVLAVCERVGGPSPLCETFVSAWILFEATARVRLIEEPLRGLWYDDLVLEDPFLWEPPPPPS